MMNRQPLSSRYPGSASTRNDGEDSYSGDGMSARNRRGRSACPTSVASVSRRGLRSQSPKYATVQHRLASPFRNSFLNPSVAAVPATLYLQRHQQRMEDHNAMGGRPLVLHHHDDSGNELVIQKQPLSDSAPEAANLRRMHILRENQKAALVNLNRPAQTSTSEGGIGGVWRAPKQQRSGSVNGKLKKNDGTRIIVGGEVEGKHPLEIKVHNLRSKSPLSPTTRSRLQSPTTRRVVLLSKL